MDDDDDEVLTRAYFIALKCIPSGSAASVAEAVLTNGKGSERESLYYTLMHTQRSLHANTRCDLHFPLKILW